MDTHVPITIHPLAPPPGAPEGHGPAEPYVEAFWLPTIGPTATWLWKRVASITTAAAGPVAFDVEDLAGQIGVQGPALRRSLDRLCRFGLAHQWSLSTSGVETTAPTLRAHQLRHLPATLQQAHALLDSREVVPA